MADLRLAIRVFQSTPVVTAVAILSLALGIGANTAIFSIADSLLLRALPVERPEGLALLVSNPAVPTGLSSWSNPMWEQVRDRRHGLFQTAFAFSARTTRLNLAQGGPTDLIDGVWVSGDYFAALGVRPMLGRTLTTDDDRRGGGPNGPVAVISHAFWQRRFGNAANVIGRTQVIERVPFTIVGVMPPGFFGADVGTTFDVAVPLGTEPSIRGRDSFLDRATTSWLIVIARLKEGQTIEAAERALRGVQPQIREATMPPGASTDVRARHFVTPAAVRPAALGTSAMRTRYRQPILAIMIVVALVLLIACANIANLLLARAASRRHEFSVRVALGASRWRLARQLLVESLLLSIAGALAGLALAHWGSALLLRQLSTQANTVFLDVRLDWRVLAFTTVVASGAAFLFGIVPAWRGSRAEPLDAIREHGRGAAGERRAGLGDLLVVGQVGLSLVLVVTAGLFVKTFASLATLDLGFDRDPLLIAQVDVRTTGVEPAERAALYGRLTDAARAVGGASHAALSAITPVSGSLIDVLVEIENGPTLTLPQNVSYRNVITPAWFATYGTRIVEGRDFDGHDQLTSPAVTIVNETFVRRFLRDGSPIGRRIRQGLPGRQGPWLDVVGVAADATYRSLRDPVPPTLYVPVAQQKEPPPSMSLSVRAASGAPAFLSRGVSEAIGRVDRNVAITFTPLKQQIDAALVQERMLAMLSGFFGGVALLLTALGLYGVTWHAVSRRRGEIGIRMALGAAPASVVRLVLSRVSALVIAGTIAGLGVCLWAAKFVAPLLHSVEPRDVATLTSSAAVLAAVGALAGWVPAHRASRIDPAAVLRDG